MELALDGASGVKVGRAGGPDRPLCSHRLPLHTLRAVPLRLRAAEVPSAN